MKALPVKLSAGRYVECPIEEATHVTLNIPGPSGRLTLPIIIKGTRAGTNCWSWNGDTERPTLKPSVLTRGHNYRCHSWVNEGKAIFLEDCSHEFRNQTVDLLDITDLC